MHVYPRKTSSSLKRQPGCSQDRPRVRAGEARRVRVDPPVLCSCLPEQHGQAVLIRRQYRLVHGSSLPPRKNKPSIDQLSILRARYSSGTGPACLAVLGRGPTAQGLMYCMGGMDRIGMIRVGAKGEYEIYRLPRRGTRGSIGIYGWPYPTSLTLTRHVIRRSQRVNMYHRRGPQMQPIRKDCVTTCSDRQRLNAALGQASAGSR